MRGSFKPLCWTAQSTLLPVGVAFLRRTQHIQGIYLSGALYRLPTFALLNAAYVDGSGLALEEGNAANSAL